MAGVFAAGFCVFAAWVLVLPPFRTAPVFYANVMGGREVYPCAAGSIPLPVRFSPDGLTAWVTFRGSELRLPYARSNGFEDSYRTGPWELTMDPEVNFWGPGGMRLFCGG